MNYIRVHRKLLGHLCFIALVAVIFSGCQARLNAGLQVLTNDVAAAVYLDGKLMENTPYVNKELKAGDYSLEIRPQDSSLVSYQTKVSLKSGMLTVVSWQPGQRPETSGGVIFETEPLRDKKATELLITTIPDGGIIYVDGVARGFAPVTIPALTAGEHQFEVRLPSYETQTHPINLLEGYRVIVTVKLGKQDYQAPRTNPNPASVSAAVSATDPATASSSATLAPPKVIILRTGFIQNGRQVLRVRDAAGTTATELGFAPVGTEYRYLNEAQSGWVKIQFGDTPGWVSQQFVQIVE